MGRIKRYPQEVRERAVRMVFDQRAPYQEKTRRRSWLTPRKAVSSTLTGLSKGTALDMTAGPTQSSRWIPSEPYTDAIPVAPAIS